MQKSVQAAAIFWPRVSQNSRSYFPIIKLSLFSHPVFVMPSKSKQIIFGREQGSGLFLRKQLNSMAVSYFVEERKKNIATLICTRKNYLLLLTEKKKDFPPQKEILSWSNTLHSVYTWIILAGKNQTHYLFQSQKLFLTLMPFCPRNFFCIKVAMYFTLYVFVWGKKV